MDGKDANQDLTAFVQNLLEQMQARFQSMSENVLSRIDEMGGRLDDLEKSISDLIHQAGVEDNSQEKSLQR